MLYDVSCTFLASGERLPVINRGVGAAEAHGMAGLTGSATVVGVSPAIRHGLHAAVHRLQVTIGLVMAGGAGVMDGVVGKGYRHRGGAARGPGMATCAGCGLGHERDMVGVFVGGEVVARRGSRMADDYWVRLCHEGG